MLKTNKSLEDLNIGIFSIAPPHSIADNQIETRGAELIAGALRDNANLQSLNIANNYIYERGTEAIADAIRENKTLKKVDISKAFEEQ